MNELFARIARRTAHLTGSAWGFLAALAVVLGWAVVGPVFHFSETWQLVINTGTTIVTFLMVFLIQSSQNHDSAAMQIKLDELLRAVHGAHNSMIALESATEEEMDRHARALHRLAGLHEGGSEGEAAAAVDGVHLAQDDEDDDGAAGTEEEGRPPR
ncbi:MAG: low affinity iron permease family protein [Dehalococcoidia bacterium]